MIVKHVIPYEIIKLAVNGDTEAMNYILKYFDAYMTSLSRKTVFDARGNDYTYVDQDIKRRLEIKLVISVLKFKIKVV